MTTTLSRPRAWALALTATFTMAVSYVDRQTLAVLAPTVQKELSISENAYAGLVSAFAFAYLCGAPLAGWLIDRVGARRGLLGAVLVWSAVAALHALAPGFGVLFALRIALGLAESPSFPGASQTVQRALPPADRARGFGVLFTGSSFGSMVAPLLATYLESRFKFRVAFLGTALVGLLWVPMWLLMAYREPGRSVLDRAEVEPARRAEGAAAEAERTPGAWEMLKHPAVQRGALLIFASAPLITLFFNWSAKFLVTEFGLTQKELGKYLVLPPLLLDVGAVLFGHFASEARARGEREVPQHLVAIATAMMLAGAAVPFMRGPLEAMLAVSVSVAGGGGLYTLTTSDMLSRVPPSRVATVGGISAAAQSVSQIVMSFVIGLSVTATKGYTQIILLLVAWVLPGCVGWLLWRLPAPQEAGTTSG